MSAATAAAHAAAQAIKASGTIVQVEPEDFRRILERSESPLVVVAPAGFFSSGFRYLTSYKGLAFFAKSDEQISLPPRTEVIQARKIWVPEHF
jgi:ABC-type branched-subunit amino acid transport system substrate-binding protein